MTVELTGGFGLGRDRTVPKGSPSWFWRCACGGDDCRGLMFGPYKTKREAERTAKASLQSVVSELSASIVDGGSEQH